MLFQSIITMKLLRHFSIRKMERILVLLVVNQDQSIGKIELIINYCKTR